jgi:hypothetical protein
MLAHRFVGRARSSWSLSNAVHSLAQLQGSQPPAALVLDLDIVALFGAVNTDLQQQTSLVRYFTTS